MRCKVQGVYMNPRYRVLTVEEQNYILDMGGWSFWKILFPFAYWISPNTVYKIGDGELIEKIIVPEVKSKPTGGNVLLASVIGIILANLLQPLISLFDIEGTPLGNAIIVGIVFFITLGVFFYINIINKVKLAQLIDLNQYVKQRLWIRPHPIKHFIFIMFSYLFLLVCIIFIWGRFIQIANTVILLIGMMILFCIFITSLITIGVGDTKVRFKADK